MKAKAFDCLAMKSQLQRQLLDRLQGLTCDEQRAIIRNDLKQSNSPMGCLWRALAGAGSTATGTLNVAEDSSDYDSKQGT